MSHRSLLPLAIILSLAVAQAQSPVDAGTVSRLRQEAQTRSQAMDHVRWLSDVYGPRVSGTPNYERAAEWAVQRFKSWGLSNVHVERFPFGQGWRVERFSAHLRAPEPQPLIGYPRTYSPSTKGPINADVVRVGIRSDADFARYKGQLKGKVVLPQPARAVRMLEGRLVLRMEEKEIAEALAPPAPAPAAPKPPPAATPPASRPPSPFAIARFFVDEGVAAVLDRGSDNDRPAGGSDLSWTTQRVDGGTIFPGSGGSRDATAPTQVPSVTLAVEHYNRIVRLLEMNQPVRVELNIETTFYPENAARPNGITVIADIPGSDLAHEVVIMGAHLDTTPGSTGATDNATGVAAMMEVARVVATLGLKPRRTIRIALWGAEEQGLLGSRAYVQTHYGTAAKPTPAHANVAAYYNLDNGTGRIRGIWGQGNHGAMALFSQWIEAVRDLGVEFVGPRSVGATDHASFDSQGLPGFQFMQERLEYNSRTHHSNMDFVDRVQPDDLVQQATVASVFAWYTANWPEKLPRKAPVAPRPDPAQ